MTGLEIIGSLAAIIAAMMGCAALLCKTIKDEGKVLDLDSWSHVCSSGRCR